MCQMPIMFLIYRFLHLILFDILKNIRNSVPNFFFGVWDVI